MKGEQVLEHSRALFVIGSSGLKDTGTAFEREQFDKVCGASRCASGKLRRDQPVFECERTCQLNSRFLVESGSRQRACEFVIERRKATVLARETQHALGIERALLRHQSTSQGDLRPGVARLDGDSLFGHLQRTRAVRVRRIPVGRACQQQQVARIILERGFQFALGLRTISHLEERQHDPGAGCLVRRISFQLVTIEQERFFGFAIGAAQVCQTPASARQCRIEFEGTRVLISRIGEPQCM